VTEKLETPSNKVTIVVQPSAAHPDILSVQDAMRQVLDFFDLLVPDDQEPGGLIWNLTLASTNTPLTVVGEPRSLRSDVDVSIVARSQRRIVADQLRSLTSGGRPSRVLSRKRRDTIRRIFTRNTQGIGRTDVSVDVFDDPVLITPTRAESGIKALEAEEKEFDSFLLDNRGREEIGSIEGYLLDVGTEYNQPAILVRERKTDRDIWCRVDPQLKHEISESARFEDVWARRRVIVRGRVVYDVSGVIVRVHAQSVTPIKSRNMTVHDIKDDQFGDGLSTKEYLDKLREGELGD
jgi:hypothetical protein